MLRRRETTTAIRVSIASQLDGGEQVGSSLPGQSASPLAELPGIPTFLLLVQWCRFGAEPHSSSSRVVYESRAMYMLVIMLYKHRPTMLMTVGH